MISLHNWLGQKIVPEGCRGFDVLSFGEKDKDCDISVHSEGFRHTKMTDVIDAVEAATIAVVDMSFKVRTPRLAGHWIQIHSTLNMLSTILNKLNCHLGIIYHLSPPFYIFKFLFSST